MSIIIISSLFVLLCLSIAMQYSYAQNASVLSESTSGFNYTNVCEDIEFCNQLGIQWWKWAYGIPSEINPANDETGTQCGINQTGTVWNLAGTFDGKLVVRECTISSEKVIFFPIFNSFCSPSEIPELKTDQDMIECAAERQGLAYGLEATLKKLDTNELVRLPHVNVVTEAFDFWIPKDNNFGVASEGIIRGAGNGAYVGIGSLEPGEYELRFKGTDFSPSNPSNPTIFTQDNIYKLHIVPADKT